jgi:hypothetical protein
MRQLGLLTGAGYTLRERLLWGGRSCGRTTGAWSASLSRPVSSSSLMTSCCHPFSLRLMTQHGALASLRGRHKPPHDGMREGWGGTICRASLPLVGGRIGGPYELTPPVVPVRTFCCRSRTRYLLACNFPAFSADGSGNPRSGGAVLLPAELAAINPHPVQNHGQAPSDRDDGATYPTPLSHPDAPRLQPRPFPAVSKQ